MNEPGAVSIKRARPWPKWKSSAPLNAPVNSMSGMGVAVAVGIGDGRALATAATVG
jgi:hypothetical protein